MEAQIRTDHSRTHPSSLRKNIAARRKGRLNRANPHGSTQVEQDQPSRHSKVDYADWIAWQRAAAIARGGKPLRYVPGKGHDQYPRATKRQAGEIINPVTGEIVADCLTISKLAEKLKTSPQKIVALLKMIGAVDHVLKTKEVSMISAPHLTKPQYEHIPEARGEGVAEGLLIPITFKHGNRKLQCLFITPSGQDAVEEILKAQENTASKEGKVQMKQRILRELLSAGHSQASIARLTGWPKQTVSRLARAMTEVST